MNRLTNTPRTHKRLASRRGGAVALAGGGLLLAALLLAGCESSTSPPAPLASAKAASPTVNETFNNLGGLLATAKATVRCLRKGTQVVVHFSGLRPKGVYTVWLFTYVPPGFDGVNPANNRDGVGALGANDGSQNAFRASASGEGQLSVIQPAGALSAFGSSGDCLMEDEFQFHLVLFFHTDGLTHGPVPGPGFPEGGFIFD